MINNYIARGFDILATSFSVYNYFESSTELFSNLCLIKFLDTFVKPVFLCINVSFAQQRTIFNIYLISFYLSIEYRFTYVFILILDG